MLRDSPEGPVFDFKARVTNRTSLDWEDLSFEVVLHSKDGKVSTLPLEAVSSLKTGQSMLILEKRQSPVPLPEFVSFELRLRSAFRKVPKLVDGYSGIVATNKDCLRDLEHIGSLDGVSLRKASAEFVALGCGTVAAEPRLVSHVSSQAPFRHVVTADLTIPGAKPIKYRAWLLRRAIVQQVITVTEPFDPQ